MELTARILFLCACVAHYGVQMRHFVHMLQLNSYRPERFRAWQRDNRAALLAPARWLPAIACALSLGVYALGTALPLPEVLAPLVAALLMGMSAALNRPRQAKKPLVCTARVKRLFATAGVLLLLVLGCSWLLPTWAGVPLSALALLPVWWWTALANRLNQPVEAAIAARYVEDARRRLRAMPELIVIGITGSYGKTSAKNFLYALLSAHYNVLMTPESYNTTMGVVRTVREQLHPFHQVFIVEMGAKNPGDIREICELVQPRYGLLTSIGEQHLETFHTLDAIINTKFELVDTLPPDGIAFLNVDNPYIRAHGWEGHRAVTYGTSAESGAAYTASAVTVGGDGSCFTVSAPDGESCAFTTKLLGAHTIQNLTGCIAVAHTLGIPMPELLYPVRLLKPVAHRLQLLPNGFIDDAYNSNPAGFRAALDVLREFEGQRVLMTPGMVELGERQDVLNRELGRYAAACCDYAVLVGVKQAPPLREGLREGGFPEERIFVAKTLSEGLSHLTTLPVQGRRTVLLENDLPDNFL